MLSLNSSLDSIDQAGFHLNRQRPSQDLPQEVRTIHSILESSLKAIELGALEVSLELGEVESFLRVLNNLKCETHFDLLKKELWTVLKQYQHHPQLQAIVVHLLEGLATSDLSLAKPAHHQLQVMQGKSGSTSELLESAVRRFSQPENHLTLVGALSLASTGGRLARLFIGRGVSRAGLSVGRALAARSVGAVGSIGVESALFPLGHTLTAGALGGVLDFSHFREEFYHGLKLMSVLGVTGAMSRQAFSLVHGVKAGFKATGQVTRLHSWANFNQRAFPLVSEFSGLVGLGRYDKPEASVTYSLFSGMETMLSLRVAKGISHGLFPGLEQGLRKLDLKTTELIRQGLSGFRESVTGLLPNLTSRLNHRGLPWGPSWAWEGFGNESFMVGQPGGKAANSSKARQVHIDKNTPGDTLAKASKVNKWTGKGELSGLSGKIIAGELSIDLAGSEQAAEIHKTLVGLARICDKKRMPRRIIVPWRGNLTQLLPYSLLDFSYDVIRVSPEGDLVLYNFSHPPKGQSPESWERETSVGIQKVINESNGLVGPMDLEDISVGFVDTELRSYAEAALGKPQNHLDFCAVYHLYADVLEQAQAIRAGLSHLLPPEANETIRIQLGANQKLETALYRRRATDRGKQSRLDLQAQHYHARLIFPEHDYAFEGDPPRVVITPRFLDAELRHHVHYFYLDQKGRKLPEGLLGSGLAELVDDAGDLAEKYYKLAEQSMAGLIILLQGEEVGKILWAAGTILHGENNPRLTGHIFTRQIHDYLLEYCLILGRKLSDRDLQRIDQAIFQFASRDFPERLPPMWLLVQHLTRLDRLQQLKAPELILKNEKEMAAKALNKDIDTIDWEEFIQFARHYNAFKLAMNNYFEARQELEGVNRYHPNYHAVHERYFDALLQLETLSGLLKVFMLQHLPYHAPNGRTYHSAVAYYLDPELILEAIVAANPDLV